MKRKLRPSIQILLTINTIIFFPLLMINDFELCFLPFYLVGIAIELTSIYLLLKYGKGIYGTNS